MQAPAAVLALVLLATAVGGLAVAWAAPTWGRVRHGYEILVGATLGLMAVGAWAALRGPLATAGGAAAAEAAWAGRLVGALAVLAVASPVAIAAGAHRAGRALGVLAAVVGAASFVPLAQLRAAASAPGGVGQGLAELALGSVFVGSVWVGMILGHWYLVERRLGKAPMVWLAWANVAGVAAGLGSVLLSGRNPVPCEGLSGPAAELCLMQYSPVLAVGNFTVVMGLGLVALVAIISVFNVKLAREGGRSIQAATGMFYLAVVLAPAAEFAAKVRFF